MSYKVISFQKLLNNNIKYTILNRETCLFELSNFYSNVSNGQHYHGMIIKNTGEVLVPGETTSFDFDILKDSKNESFIFKTVRKDDIPVFVSLRYKPKFFYTLSTYTLTNEINKKIEEVLNKLSDDLFYHFVYRDGELYLQNVVTNDCYFYELYDLENISKKLNLQTYDYNNINCIDSLEELLEIQHEYNNNIIGFSVHTNRKFKIYSNKFKKSFDELSKKELFRLLFVEHFDCDLLSYILKKVPGVNDFIANISFSTMIPQYYIIHYLEKNINDQYVYQAYESNNANILGKKISDSYNSRIEVPFC